MNILIIMTGGTISTTVTPSGHLAANGKETVSLLSERYYETSGVLESEVSFEYSHPLDILSENMTFPRLNRLLDELRRIPYERYDGIVIAHGTDTLAYTSSLLSCGHKKDGPPIEIFIPLNSFIQTPILICNI